MVTVTVQLALADPLTAVITADPVATAVTTPLSSTVAYVSSLELHVISAPSGIVDA